MNLNFFVLTCLCLLTGTVYAASCEKVQLRAARVQAELPLRFASADVNKDGVLSREELLRARPKVVTHFDRIAETHRQNYVTLAQAKAYVDERVSERLANCRSDTR
jgi:hypothetical protein